MLSVLRSFFELFKQKTPTYELYFALWGRKRSPKFVRYLNVLIVATVAGVQWSMLLFALGGKFKLKKDEPIKRSYSKSFILIGWGTDLCPAGNFCRFKNGWEIRPHWDKDNNINSMRWDERRAWFPWNRRVSQKVAESRIILACCILWNSATGRFHWSQWVAEFWRHGSMTITSCAHS